MVLAVYDAIKQSVTTTNHRRGTNPQRDSKVALLIMYNVYAYNILNVISEIGHNDVPG